MQSEKTNNTITNFVTKKYRWEMREFTLKEKKFIVKCLLTKINLTLHRGSVVNLRFNNFGTFHTHKNKKRMSKIKYLRRYNKSSWKETKQKQEKDINFILWNIIIFVTLYQ